MVLEFMLVLLSDPRTDGLLVSFFLFTGLIPMMLDILSLDGEAMPAKTSSTTLVISIARLLLLQFNAL